MIIKSPNLTLEDYRAIQYGGGSGKMENNPIDWSRFRAPDDNRTNEEHKADYDKIKGLQKELITRLKHDKHRQFRQIKWKFREKYYNRQGRMSGILLMRLSVDGRIFSSLDDVLKTGACYFSSDQNGSVIWDEQITCNSKIIINPTLYDACKFLNDMFYAYFPSGNHVFLESFGDDGIEDRCGRSVHKLGFSLGS